MHYCVGTPHLVSRASNHGDSRARISECALCTTRVSFGQLANGCGCGVSRLPLSSPATGWYKGWPPAPVQSKTEGGHRALVTAPRLHEILLVPAGRADVFQALEGKESARWHARLLMLLQLAVMCAQRHLPPFSNLCRLLGGLPAFARLSNASRTSSGCNVTTTTKSLKNVWRKKRAALLGLGLAIRSSAPIASLRSAHRLVSGDPTFMSSLMCECEGVVGG